MGKSLFLLLFFSITLFASISFEKDYKKAVAKAKEENKALFVMISSPTCPECNFMKKNVFTKKEVSDYINKNYVSFSFDIKDKKIPKQMQFWGIPRFYLSNDGENVYKKKMGGMKEDKFMQFIKGDE